jgi:hypothetical protein
VAVAVAVAVHVGGLQPGDEHAPAVKVSRPSAGDREPNEDAGDNIAGTHDADGVRRARTTKHPALSQRRP